MAAAVSSSPRPKKCQQLQDTLWTTLDVLPALDSTPLRLDVTQNTSAYNLGFIATRNIQLGEILVSVPWQFAISVDAEDRRGAPSDLRLALRLIEVLDDSGTADDARGRAWCMYSAEVLSAPNHAAVLWDDAEIEELQFEDAIEYVRALKGQARHPPPPTSSPPHFPLQRSRRKRKG